MNKTDSFLGLFKMCWLQTVLLILGILAGCSTAVWVSCQLCLFSLCPFLSLPLTLSSWWRCSESVRCKQFGSFNCVACLCGILEWASCVHSKPTWLHVSYGIRPCPS